MSTLGIERIEEGAVGGGHKLAAPAKAFNAPESVLDRLRRRNEQAQGDQHVDIPVQGYNGDLGVRYRALYESEQKKIARDNDEYAELDGLLAACVCILVKGESGKLEPLTHQGELVRFDDVLADILGIEINHSHEKHGPARQIVLGVFRTAPSPFRAAQLHSERIAHWMVGGEADQEARLLGE